MALAKDRTAIKRLHTLDRLLGMATPGPYGCWLWTGTSRVSAGKGRERWDQDPYGYVEIAGKARRVHRVMYELAVGPIPPGHHVDHACPVPNTLCIRWDHLDAVTPDENQRRKWARITTDPYWELINGAPTSRGLVAVPPLPSPVREVRVEPAMAVPGPDPRALVLEAIQGGHGTPAEIVAATRVPRSTVLAALRTLEEAGRIRHEGHRSSRSQPWTVVI